MAAIRMTPSQRTLSYLKEGGFTVGTVERFVNAKSFHGSGHRRDLFGCIDLIAVRPQMILAVQSTGTGWSSHWKKMVEGSGRPGAMLWLSGGSPLLLIGWRPLKGGYQPRVHWFLPEDFLLGCKMDRHRSEEDWASGVQ